MWVRLGWGWPCCPGVLQRYPVITAPRRDSIAGAAVPKTSIEGRRGDLQSNFRVDPREGRGNHSVISPQIGVQMVLGRSLLDALLNHRTEEMTFVFNENACHTIIGFFSERLKHIRNEIEFMEREMSLATNSAVRFAMNEALARRKHDEAFAQMKISEMEHYLNGSTA